MPDCDPRGLSGHDCLPDLGLDVGAAGELPRGPVPESFGVAPSYGSPADLDLAIYLELLDKRRIEPKSLAAAVGADEQEILASCRRLVAMGLLSGSTDDPGVGLARDPEAVRAQLIGPLEERIRRDQRRIVEISHELDRFAVRYHGLGDRVGGGAELIDSVKEVREALNLAADRTNHEMISCQPRGGVRSPEAMEEALRRDTRLLERGVSMRTIYQHAARFNGPSQAYVAAASALGAQYRTVHQAFGQLIAFDRKIAFIPRVDDSPGAVVLREESTVAFLCEIFERSWEQATPFADAAAQGMEQVSHEIRETIVQLLAAGLKDETIARRLGMSSRTVRRHIAEIMDELNATSRFQAGVVAASAGLLEHRNDAHPA